MVRPLSIILHFLNFRMTSGAAAVDPFVRSRIQNSICNDDCLLLYVFLMSEWRLGRHATIHSHVYEIQTRFATTPADLIELMTHSPRQSSRPIIQRNHVWEVSVDKSWMTRWHTHWGRDRDLYKIQIIKCYNSWRERSGWTYDGRGIDFDWEKKRIR